MARYVNLDNLLAEIERLREVQPLDAFQPKEQNKIDWLAGKLFTITNLEVFLNTLEVKDVDLEKHLKEDIEDVFFDLNGVAVKGATYYLTVEDVKDIAKHFFKLGLKAKD